MKKIFLIITLNLLSIALFAQSNSLYVTFIESTDTENRIRHDAWGSYDNLFYRYEPHSFRVKQSGVIRSFSYANLNSQPDEPVMIQTTSFLDTVEYLDWNSEIMNFSRDEFYAFLKLLESYDKVYFIDRAEIKDGMMKMYPVKEMKSLY